MYSIFIDESGIHKNIDHSSFALVYIEVKNNDLLESQIKEIENKLKIEYFHWSTTVWKVKEIFINEVLKLNFKVKIAIIENPVNPSDEIEKILNHMIIERNIKNIYIDGKKPKWYERKIILRSLTKHWLKIANYNRNEFCNHLNKKTSAYAEVRKAGSHKAAFPLGFVPAI